MKRLWLTLFALWLCALCSSTSSWAQSANVNTAASILPSSTFTATTLNLPDQLNSNWKGAHVIINISSFTAGSVTPHIQGKDPVSGVYYDLLVGTALTATGTTVLKVYPGIAATANAAASDLLPQVWRVQLVGSSANMVLSVGANLEY